ncbi:MULTISPECIES: hypothetical protein [unclassified Marinobacter]|uniref:hypothetical protein n=1 Tax=unclassified Marinobacter TaxID=83889 RepID=UPI00200BB447|nr:MULTISPECIES: hypothetical protein [unclassified Marinobacter]UQG56579.1 hypothetical protein MIH16_02595 [Marinobacter sp. M4C]UQG65383.1 hypothetical protein MIH17_02595 [Marinobacter sp. M2C]UQG69662.1 hypothetical protein MIH19_02590 [Marinobacter sp. M1C]
MTITVRANSYKGLLKALGPSGVSALLGSESTLSRKVVQSKGFAYRMNASELKAEFNNNAQISISLRFSFWECLFSFG